MKIVRRFRSICVGTVCLPILTVALGAQRNKTGAAKLPPRADRWAGIREVFHQDGQAEDGYFRVNFPRSDVDVRMGGDRLSPDFDLTTYFAFVPVGTADVMAMGEIVLRDDEAASVADEARRQQVEVTALHNHLLGETPAIVHMHVRAEGRAAAVATRLRAVLAKSATPLSVGADERSSVDWSSIDAILGKHADANGTVASYEFSRREHIMLGATAVKSSGVLETGSEATFQRLASGKYASTGELYLLEKEVEPVVRAMSQNGLHLTALHTHMLDDSPAHYWAHWYVSGDGPTLARAVAAVLSLTNSEQKSKSDK
jgi:hypothetical protein